MSRKACDFTTVPLCSDCHTAGPRAVHRIGRRTFEKERGLDFLAVAARLNEDFERAPPSASSVFRG